MKTIRYAGVLLLAVLALACRRDEKDNDTVDGPFTMNVTLPDDTAESDAVYIIGAFNGGEEFALGNPKWELKGTATQRSITLDPATFIGGKTLTDGYQFQSPTRGVEVTADGTVVVRNKKETSITIEAWEKAGGPSFDPSGIWTVVGTVNGWNEKAGLEMTVDGTARIAKGVELKASDEFKFVMDASWSTNFGAGEPNTKFTATVGEEFALQADGGNIAAPAGTYDIYLYPFEAKAKLVEAAETPGPEEKPVTGVSLQPAELTLKVGESETLTLQLSPSDADVKSLTWESSDSGVATVSQGGLVTAVAEGSATITVTVDGFTASCAVTVQDDTPGEGPTVYVFNATTWIYVYLYAWADGIGSIEAEWPGLFPDNDIPKVDGWSYYRYTLSEAWCAGEVNLIFNDGNSTGQTEDFPITMQGGESYFFYVDNGKAQLIPDPHNFDPNDYVTPEPPGPSTDPATLYVYDGNNWGSMYLYTWKGGDQIAAWPGVAAEGSETFYDHKFFKFSMDAQWCSDTDYTYLIFSNGNGSQTINLEFSIKAGQTYYFYQYNDTAELVDPSNFNPGEPPVQDNSWGIAGTMNEWSAASPIEMAVEGDYYVAKGVTLATDTEFKFVQNKSWTVNRGGTFVSLGTSFDLYQDGANIKPGLSGTYDIYIKSDGSSAYIPAP